MNYISTYQKFTEQELYEYIDSILVLNEEIQSIDWLKRKCNNVLDKVKNLSLDKKRKVLIYLVSSLLSIASTAMVVNAIHSTNDKMAISIVNKKVNKVSNFKNPLEMNISKKGIDHIKSQESLILKAYELGDGKITVGWGHAETIGKSKIKLGQVIDKQTAKKYLISDIKMAEDGVKRMFSEWQTSSNILRKVTQDQYDALVSMAMNMGVTGLRNSNVAKFLKDGQYKKAGEIIKTTKVSKSFPGLVKRRAEESRMFLSYLFKHNVNTSA